VLQNLARLAREASAADRIERLLGIEGAAGAAYFPALARGALGPQATWAGFDGKRRRPATDPMNSVLSYLYAVLVGECAAAALAAGLDPTVGFLHTERAGRPALALDLVEPLRPLIGDAVALRLLNTGELAARHFRHEGETPRLTDDGRRIVLAALEYRLAQPAPGGEARRHSYRAAVWRQAARLAAALRDGGEVPQIERG
jgi:CRISPR-associated endonuclease Cas1